MATTVTSKGRVTIPKAVRASLGIKARDSVVFEKDDRGRFVIEKTEGGSGPDRFERARGSAGPGPTTDEIMSVLRGDPKE